MAAAQTPGNLVSGISADTWYSIQSFSSDYYLGLSNDSQPQVELLSGDDVNSTLWQFTPAGPDTSKAVYSLRSAASSGLYCVYASGDGPIAVPCGTNAGQLQALYGSSSGGTDDGLVIVPCPNSGSQAFSADGDSSEGDRVGFTELSGFDSADVDVLWAIRSQGTVDTALYPAVSATYTEAPSASASATSTTSVVVLTNATSVTASATGSMTAETTLPTVVVTAADGSTVSAPTGTPSPRPEAASPSIASQSSVTVTTTMEVSSSGSGTASPPTESASASPSVETQQGNNARSMVPARAVWLGMVGLALLAMNV